MKLRDTYYNDPYFWGNENAIDADYEDVTKADIDKWEAKKQDGEFLEPVTPEESVEHFEEKSK